jgi:hypothetical protein
MDKKEKEIIIKRESGAEAYIKKYPSQMASLDKSPLSRVRPHGLEAVDYVNLGKQLESWEGYHKFCEADGSVTQLGQYPNIALDALTVNFGQSPISVIAATQPIDEVQGIVYFRDFQAQNTRGNVTAGENILSTLSIPDVFPKDFASDSLFNNTFLTDGSPSSGIYTAVSLTGGEDFGSPINPQTITLYGTVVVASGTATFANIVPDPVSGAFSQVAKEGSTSGYLAVQGTVNYTNGTVSLTLTSLDSQSLTSVSFSGSYQTVEEANTDLQKAILVLQTKPVRARFFALKSTMGLAESYMLRKRFGISAEEEIAKDLVVALNLEIMNTAVDILSSNVPTSPTNVIWHREAPQGVSYFEHLMTLPAAMADSDAQIVARAGRGTVNCWLVGRQAGAIMSQLPGFNKLSDDNSFGPHIFGQYNGATIVRVPYASVLDDNTMLGIFKGPGNFEAPLVYAPYMPLVVTNTLPMAYNPLQNQRAAAIWAALDPMITNFQTKLTIKQSSPTFDYGNSATAYS